VDGVFFSLASQKWADITAVIDQMVVFGEGGNLCKRPGDRA